MRQYSLIVRNKGAEVWSSTWSGTNGVRTLCHHLNWVVGNNRGDTISQRYSEPCLPINQILLKIWKIPYVQTVQFPSTCIASFEFLLY